VRRAGEAHGFLTDRGGTVAPVMGETLRRTLEVLGIAEEDPADDDVLAALERRVDEQADEIAALRAELDALRARP